MLVGVLSLGQKPSSGGPEDEFGPGLQVWQILQVVKQREPALPEK